MRRGDAHRSTASATAIPQLVVMDTTDEAAIAGALARLEPGKTLFLVASKSGGTIEPASMEKLFWQHMSAALGDGAGRQFVAITDPGTALAQLGRRSAATAKSSSTRPTSADASPRCRSSGWCRPRSSARRCARCSRARADMADGCRQENHAEPRPRARRVHRRAPPRAGATS